jgi:hypothetical protein
LPVAGIDYLVHVWRILGASLVGSRFEALRTASTPLIGREEELALLTRRWERAKAGDGSVVLIVGEPGIGQAEGLGLIRFYGDASKLALLRKIFENRESEM